MMHVYASSITHLLSFGPQNVSQAHGRLRMGGLQGDSLLVALLCSPASRVPLHIRILHTLRKQSTINSLFSATIGLEEWPHFRGGLVVDLYYGTRMAGQKVSLIPGVRVRES